MTTRAAGTQVSRRTNGFKAKLRFKAQSLLGKCLVTAWALFHTQTLRAEAPLQLPPGDQSFFETLDLSRPDLRDVQHAVEHQDWKAARDAWAAHLQTRATPQWVWSRHDRKAIEQVYADQYGGLAKFVPQADLVLARHFTSQGVLKVLDHDPQWNQGPLEWTHVLSRFAYFIVLGKAYWATNDPKYAEDYVYLLEHWIAENPVPNEVKKSASVMGSRWRTLETGFRGRSLFDDLELFMDARAFDADAKTLLTRSLVEHARRLYAYETTYRTGNWQVCECTGLSSIGIMLPEMKEAAQWRQRGLDYLAQHMKKDVFADGAHSELTPLYHAWVTEQYAFIARLCKLNAVATPPGMLDRHEKMYEFLMNIAKPDRTTFPIGDAGRGEEIAADMASGALLYGRPDFRWLGPSVAPEGLLWLFGPTQVSRYAALPGTPADPASRLLPDAHLAVMRTGWDRTDSALLFNFAPWGGGHNHRDRLEVCLYSGRDLLVDPGQISYDDKLSSTYFRTSDAHNVMTVDGHQLPTLDPKFLAWSSGPSADFASAALDYDGIHQQRVVLFVRPDYWIVLDRVSMPQARDHAMHQLVRQFHFCPGTAASDGASAYTDDAAEPRLAVIDASNTPATIVQGWVAAGKGAGGNGTSAAAAPVAVFTNREALPAVHCTVLMALNDPKQRPTVEQDPTASLRAAHVRVHFPDGRTDEFVIGDGEQPTSLTLGNTTAVAWAVGTIGSASAPKSIVVKP